MHSGAERRLGHGFRWGYGFGTGIGVDVWACGGMLSSQHVDKQVGYDVRYEIV